MDEIADPSDTGERLRAARSRISTQKEVIASMLPGDPGFPTAFVVLAEMQKTLSLVKTRHLLAGLDVDTGTLDQRRSL